MAAIQLSIEKCRWSHEQRTLDWFEDKHIGCKFSGGDGMNDFSDYAIGIALLMCGLAMLLIALDMVGWI